MDETDAGVFWVGTHSNPAQTEVWATAFATGFNANGYTLNAVTVKFGAVTGSP